MSNEAAERLRLHFETHDGPCHYCRSVARVDIRDALTHERSAEHEPEAREYGGDVFIVCLNPECRWYHGDGPFWMHWWGTDR